MARAPRYKTIKGVTRTDQFGIVNPYGQIWTTDTFDSPEAAQAHLNAFWRGTKEAGIERFAIVPVRVRVTPGRSLEGDGNG